MATLTDLKQRQILFQIAPAMAQSGQYRNTEEIARVLRERHIGVRIHFSEATIAWLDELCDHARGEAKSD